MSSKLISVLFLSMALLSACASSKMKERKEQRDRVAQNSKMFCEFINGENYPDIDIALNLEMAKRCDFEKPFSMSQYHSRSDSTGMIYCCSTNGGKPQARRTEQSAPASKANEDKGAANEIIE